MPNRAGGHGPKGGANSTLLIDATAKNPMPPLALPTKPYMLKAKAIWEELGLPRLAPQPPWHGYELGDWAKLWDEFAQNHKRGDKLKGPVKSITDFGVFVGLAAGIDGLVHLSDLSWHEAGETAVRNYKKGQEVEAIVLAIDVERERISLGIKQLDGDPFATYTTLNDRGATVTGKVKTVDPRGAEIQLSDDVTGYLRASEISRDRVEDARNVLKEGDEVTALIINVDRKTRSIQLSIKAKDNVDNQEAMQRLQQSSERENAGTTSLGALLKAKLDKN